MSHQGNWKQEIEVGTVVNQNYSVLGVMANGEYSTLFFARDIVSAQAIVLKTSRINDLFSIRYSLMETRILEQISKQDDCGGKGNCAKMLAASFFKDFRHWRVMEMYGQNLKDFVSKEQPLGLSIPETQFISKEILKGFEFLHRAKIIHGDIKPQNICYARHHVCDTLTNIKIIDFGKSVSSDSIGDYEVCAPFYRPVEVWLKNDWNSKIDMYGVGCIIIEAFYGRFLIPTHHVHSYLTWTEKLFNERIPDSMRNAGNLYLFYPSGMVRQCGECEDAPAMSQLYDLSRSENLVLAKFSELCSGLLNPDPSKRFSAVEALSHPFFDRMISFPDNRH